MTYHPLTQTITTLLQENDYWFESFEHQPVLTSHEAAQIRTGYSLEQGAKALIIQVKKNQLDRYFVMLVVPGNTKFTSSKVKSLLATKNFRFATEEEISHLTNGVKIGGIPPMGNLFGIKVLVDKSILDQPKIIFNAGDRSYSIAMKTEDYLELVKPEIAEIV